MKWKIYWCEYFPNKREATKRTKNRTNIKFTGYLEGCGIEVEFCDTFSAANISEAKRIVREKHAGVEIFSVFNNRGERFTEENLQN